MSDLVNVEQVNESKSDWIGELIRVETSEWVTECVCVCVCVCVCMWMNEWIMNEWKDTVNYVLVK